jgi:hypothetical protein
VRKRDAWCTNPLWDDAARADFDEHIRRSRAGPMRAFYFKVKARYLWLGGDGEPPRQQAALALLDRALGEAGGDGGVTAELLEELALFQLAAGDRAAGTASLRRCLEIAASNRRWRRYVAETLLARCLLDAGAYPAAIRQFDAFYAASDARRDYDALEQREVFTSDGAPHGHPDDAAEYIVAYHHAGDREEPAVPEVARSDRSSVAALDRLFAITEPKFREPLRRPYQPREAYAPEFLEKHFVPELGAYLGRVLVNTAGGKWIARAPLMKSRVRLGRREVNPFRAAFATAFYELPLAVALEQVESTKPGFALP